jgi:hypothetical protein
MESFGSCDSRDTVFFHRRWAFDKAKLAHEKERLLTPWNRFENRLVGLIFAGFALLVMYSIWHWGLFQTEASS